MNYNGEVFYLFLYENKNLSKIEGRKKISIA